MKISRKLAIVLVSSAAVLMGAVPVPAQSDVDRIGSAAVSVGAGQAIYAQTCVACHGAEGNGAIPGVADLRSHDGALSKSDGELIESITQGFQSPGSALAMPANGGNPTLTENDVKAVLAYLRAEFGAGANK